MRSHTLSSHARTSICSLPQMRTLTHTHPHTHPYPPPTCSRYTGRCRNHASSQRTNATSSGSTSSVVSTTSYPRFPGTPKIDPTTVSGWHCTVLSESRDCATVVQGWNETWSRCVSSIRSHPLGCTPLSVTHSHSHSHSHTTSCVPRTARVTLTGHGCTHHVPHTRTLVRMHRNADSHAPPPVLHLRHVLMPLRTTLSPLRWFDLDVLPLLLPLVAQPPHPPHPPHRLLLRRQVRCYHVLSPLGSDHANVPGRARVASSSPSQCMR
jgi:hypothetical protein